MIKMIGKNSKEKNDESRKAPRARGSETLITLKDITKKYNLYNKKEDRIKEALDPMRRSFHTDFFALRNVSLSVKRGEILGIVGRNGSGKSTLLKIVSGIVTPTAGAVNVKGTVVALLELGAGFNPEFTGMENIYFYCSILGLVKREIDAIVEEIIEFSELGRFIHQPLKTYSSGMRARLGFSVSVFVDPDILIIDEVLAVGDEQFRKKCHERMQRFFRGGKTILFVSHAVESVNELCTRAVMLRGGELVAEGPTEEVTTRYEQYLYEQQRAHGNVVRRV